MSDYTEFRWYDYVIFAATLAISLGIGIYYALTGGKQKTTKEYLLANRNMGTFPVALSIYVSHISGKKIFCRRIMLTLYRSSVQILDHSQIQNNVVSRSNDPVCKFFAASD